MPQRAPRPGRGHGGRESSPHPRLWSSWPPPGRWGLVLLSLVLGGAAVALAQERLGIDPPSRPGPAEPAFPAAPPPPAVPSPMLPPLPPLPPEEQERLPQPRLWVQEIRLTGNTVFSARDLAAVTEDYVNRTVTSEELEALRLALTRFYVSRGYVNSGALLPDQTITDGVVTVQIVEGTLSNVVIDGQRWFREGYLRRRLALDPTTPLNIGAVQERLQRLQQDERLERLEAELTPGVRPGESLLRVHVVERVPWFVALEFNNYQSPSIGAERGLLTVAHRNLTGHGDVLSVTYGRSAGLDLQLDASYSLPLTPQDTTLSVRYRRNNASVVEERLQFLDITSRSEVASVSLRHPWYRTLRQEFALTLGAEYLQSDTFFLNEASGGRERFPGSGKARDTALRLSAEWLDRTPTQVLALRARVSVGLDVFHATPPADATLGDGRFVAWLGQAQWARRIPLLEMTLLARLDVQLANDPLLPLEQLALGGRFSVRGYRENTLVRDNGVLVALEAQIPLIRNVWWAEAFQVIPFVDAGRGWNQRRRDGTVDDATLVSVGLGVRWAFTWGKALPLRSQLEMVWGQKLKNVQTAGGNLQDKGLHVQFVTTLF